MKTNRVTQQDLGNKVRSLNVVHNVDPGDLGYMTVAHHWKEYGVVKYRVEMEMKSGRVSITNWGTPKENVHELALKTWGRLLRLAKGEDRYPPARG